jgi:hypothetical protein
MANESFAKQWSDAKKEFYSKTGRKKPSEKFLKFFRWSSGLEEATANLDKAIGKLSLDSIGDCDVPHVNFIQTYRRYLKLLDKAKDGDNASEDYKKECDVLTTKLNRINADFPKRVNDFAVEQIKGWHKLTNYRSVAADVSKQASELKAAEPAYCYSFGFKETQNDLNKAVEQCQKIVPKIMVLCTNYDKSLTDIFKGIEAKDLEKIEGIISLHKKNTETLKNLKAKFDSDFLKKLSELEKTGDDLRKVCDKLAKMGSDEGQTFMKSEAFMKAFDGFFVHAQALALSLDGTAGHGKRGNPREWVILSYCSKQEKSDQFSDVKAVAGEIKAMTSSKLKSLITAFKNR